MHAVDRFLISNNSIIDLTKVCSIKQVSSERISLNVSGFEQVIDGSPIHYDALVQRWIKVINNP